MRAVLALLLTLVLTECLGRDRNDVLIGYQERSITPTDCTDQDKSCEDWAGRKPSECLLSPGFMLRSCAASCRTCGTKTMERWAGHATPQGTAHFVAGGLGFTVAEGHFRRHPLQYSGVSEFPQPQTLALSSLGIGTYLGAADRATDEAVTNAILQSVVHGWNVIDTASIYRWGRGERSVGQALRAIRKIGGVYRNQLFISTKAGYVTDQMVSSLAGRITPEEDVLGGHCMAPPCLEASLEQSRESMGLETIDLFYLHNPAESQLGQLGKVAFMQRLRAAFEFCEHSRQQGSIKAYGLATWTSFRVPPEHKAEYLNLREVVRLAEEVGGKDHGFRYIQLPVNVRMREAWIEPWQEGATGAQPVTLLQATKELGIGVFTSGPLLESQLLRSTSLQSELEGAPQLARIPGAAPKLLQLARSFPGLLTTLVGHKTPAHVEANLAVTRHSPLGEADFRDALQALAAVADS